MAMKVDFGPRIGADPELFVIARKGEQYKKNTVIPVFGLGIGGTKDEPRKVSLDEVKNYVYLPNSEDFTKHGFFGYQEDNVMFEFNIPATTAAGTFETSINGFLAWANDKLFTPKGLMAAHHLNHYEFPEKMIQHPLAQTIGCDPDFNAYEPAPKRQRKPFEITDLGNKRFCGGHLHVQYNWNNVPRHAFVRLLDIVVGLAFLSHDRQGDRRKFYGLAGLYRPKEYGVEYRTPSNFWLNTKWDRGGDHSLKHKVASNVLALAGQANNNPDDLEAVMKSIPWGDVQNAINQENVALASEIHRHIMTFFPFQFFHLHGSNRAKKAV